MRMRWSTSCICLLGMWRPTLGPAVRLWFSNHHESKDHLIQDPGSGRTRSPVALKPEIQWRGQPSKSAGRSSWRRTIRISQQGDTSTLLCLWQTKTSMGSSLKAAPIQNKRKVSTSLLTILQNKKRRGGLLKRKEKTSWNRSVSLLTTSQRVDKSNG